MTQIIGILGLIFIIIGVLVRHRSERDLVYVAGGLLLAYYSYAIQDTIFLILQIVFVLVAVYDLSRRKKTD